MESIYLNYKEFFCSINSIYQSHGIIGAAGSRMTEIAWKCVSDSNEIKVSYESHYTLNT